MVTESILIENNMPNMTKAKQILEGTLVIDGLNSDDAKVIEQAIFEKFEDKYNQIITGFGHREYDKIKKDSIHFNFGYDYYNNFKLMVHCLQKQFSHDDDPYTRLYISFKNGVDKGNAYGRPKDNVERFYKIQRISFAMKRLEEIINKFVILTDKERPAYLKQIEEQKRADAQGKLSTLAYDYRQYCEMLKKYNVKPSGEFDEKITLQINDEISSLKSNNMITQEEILAVKERIKESGGDLKL